MARPAHSRTRFRCRRSRPSPAHILMTRIGPGTRMGALYRRYWHPVAGSEEMRDRWTMRVRILGEDRVTHVCTDDYHRYDRKQRADLGITPLHPDCNYIDIAGQDLEHLRGGHAILKPVYRHADGLRPVLNGLGISIISTSRGVISDREARQRNLGGEVLCELW